MLAPAFRAAAGAHDGKVLQIEAVDNWRADTPYQPDGIGSQTEANT